MHEMFQRLIEWYTHSLEAGGYPLIVLLMAIESSIFPLPSEMVIPFAAYLAHTEGHMSVPGVIIAGTVGCWVGATLMYWISRLAGRPLLVRYGGYLHTPMERLAAFEHRLAARGTLGKLLAWDFGLVRHSLGLLFITPEKISAAERWADRYGSFGIFFSRILPVVRHLIGIPAGIVRMDFRLYSIYTLLGSGVWCSVLAWLGITAGKDEGLMRGELNRITLWAIGVCLVLGILYYVFVHRQMKAVKNAPEKANL